ncbi:hypothetical protein COCCADRAFT_647 [Bipolaris zeicola 26-R-13]|uniref:HIRAN domain-containing protein n=1 Tax=Cochliobolus carbonum (strain 26-R-13) TaxID=930089 RepID=W6Z4K2_COCC2|nr:uncharacterized protein COCCADRAFT_647 [Bipolaris zeicola 26-R-13]EUC38636.1 hypothetical protein COCCADRAFT_647 [Bipolaris zeicola 26-R-13]
MARKRRADDAYDGGSYYRAPKQSQAPDATQGYSQQHYNYLFYGALDDKIVGVRYYNGYATEGETVVLRREPHNQYDANAICVDNVRGEQIGHIPRGLAAKLAKYMDDCSLLIDARITGYKGYYECPIELLLYGTDDPVQRQQLMARMKKDRLPVGPKEATKRTKKKDAKAVGPIEGPEASMAEFAAGLPPADPSLTGPSLEDIILGSERFDPRNIEEFVEEFGVK